VNEWRKKCIVAKTEYEARGETVYQDQMRLYRTHLNDWFCRCPSYGQSANHLCKHLIVLYIGIEGLQSNKPRMPFYGEVWRQTTSPILWISGLHDIAKRTATDCQSVSTDDLPILSDAGRAIENAHRQKETVIDEPVYDSDDADDTESDVDDMRESGDEGRSEGREIGDGNSIEELYDSWGESLGDDLPENFEDEVEREVEGERIIGDILELANRLERVRNGLLEEAKYPPGHPHLRELPKAQLSSFSTWVEHFERLDRLNSSRVVVPTFSPNRRGVIFSQTS